MSVESNLTGVTDARGARGRLSRGNNVYGGASMAPNTGPQQPKVGGDQAAISAAARARGGMRALGPSGSETPDTLQRIREAFYQLGGMNGIGSHPPSAIMGQPVGIQDPAVNQELLDFFRRRQMGQ